MCFDANGFSTTEMRVSLLFRVSLPVTPIYHNASLHAPRKRPQRDPARFAEKDCLIPGGNPAKRP